MEKPSNQFISVHYQLYTIEADGPQLQEQTSREHPFQFVSGFGVALDGFEQRLLGMEKDTPFDFTLTPDEGFGAYDESGVHKMKREVFMVNNHFDHDNIFPGAVITLLDEEEHRFMARVVKVEDDGVTIDTNHPLAGKTLNFTGLLLEKREATLPEIQQMLNLMTGDDCGCGCGCEHTEHVGGCDCHGNHHHGDGCAKGDHHHHHGDGCGCGHCHQD